jgi:hypothetical protein
MKNIISYFGIFIVLFLVSDLLAQTYNCTIQNQTVNGNDFSFDIYMQRTDATEIYLGESEFSVIFNNDYFTSPTVSRVAGSELGWYNSSVAIPIGDTNIVKFSLGALFFNDDQGLFDARVCKPSTSSPGTHIATIVISSEELNTLGTAGIKWRTIPPHESKINSYVPATPWPLVNITASGTYTDPPDEPLPVELTSFSVSYINSEVMLNWKTETEVNNYGFNIERRINKGDWDSIAFIVGSGNSNSPKEYCYCDKDLFAGGSIFQYRLKQMNNDGTFEYSDVVEVEVVPDQYELSQNYPNPFNPITTIRFSLPKLTQLKINLYNMIGELVETLAEGTYDAGYHKATLNAQNLPSGAYIYRIESSEFVQVKKMILIK